MITEEDFEKHLINMQRADHLVIDTEGSLTHPYSVTWGLSTSSHSVAEYFPFRHQLGDNLPADWLDPISRIIVKHPCVVFHNAKHDLRALENLGIYRTGKFYDTMLMAHMNNENYFSKELDYLSKHFGGEPKRKSDVMDQLIKAFGWHAIPAELIREYGANDAYITQELFYNLYPDFQEQGFDGELWDYEQKFIRLMARIENRGIPVDVDLSERELARGLQIMDEIKRSLGFDPAKSTELSRFLLDEMKLPVLKRSKKTNKPSFDKEVMKAYDEMLQATNDKRAREILIFRGWQKTTSSNYRRYLELLGPDGRLRANYKIHGTVTGRMSCEDPNLQQIPRESENDWNGRLKRAFITDPEFAAFEADFSQLEFRIAAAYGKVQRLIDIFNDPRRDIFSEMAEDLGLSRHDTKTFNYTLQYGGGADRISAVFGLGRLAAKGRIRQYYEQYPGLAKATSLAKLRMEQNGFVRYWTGRRRHKGPYDDGHKAFNSVCQGGAFEIVKRRMIALDEAGLNNDECRMDLQVHDSIRFEIERGKEKIYIPEIQNIMEDVNSDFNFGVQFKVDIHKWGTKEKWDE